MTAARIRQLEAENKRLRALEVIVAEQAKLIEPLRERIAVLEVVSKIPSENQDDTTEVKECLI